MSIHDKECNSLDVWIKPLLLPTELSFRHPTLYYCQLVHLQGCQTGSGCTRNASSSINEYGHIGKKWIHNCCLNWTTRHGYITCQWCQHLLNCTANTPMVAGQSRTVNGANCRWNKSQPKCWHCRNHSECIWISEHKISHPNSTSCIRVFNKSNIVYHCQARQSHYFSKYDTWKHLSTLSQMGWNPKRSHEPEKARC